MPKLEKNSPAPDFTYSTAYENGKVFSSQLSLNTIADRLQKNPTYLSKIFKEVTKRSFLEHVRELRMEKAIAFLRSSQMKIYEIADAVGYADTTTFFRTFKAYTGVSPVDFQKRREEEDEKAAFFEHIAED